MKPPSEQTNEEGDVAALRVLCECVYQPNSIRVQTVLGHDWSRLPRVADALQELSPSTDQVTASGIARRLIESAVDDLTGDQPVAQPTAPDAITPLDVVRWHVLGGEGWDSLEARLRQEGRPLSRGTLVRRQHQFLPEFEAWARTAVGEETGLETSAESSPSKRSGRRRRLVPVGFLALFSAAFLVALHWGIQPLRSHPELAMGEAFYVSRKHTALVTNYPADTLPAGYGKFIWGMRLPGRHEEDTFLLSTTANNGNPGVLVLWDPQRDEVLWDLRWSPPRNEVLMYDVEPEAADEPFWPARLVWGRRGLNLGRYVAVSYCQVWGPSFVVFVDLETGNEVCHYAHPGRLENGSAVFDVDGDGKPEALFGGQDNSVDRPVVVILKVPSSCGASSTTNLSPGHEGAWRRILLTDLPGFRAHHDIPRFCASFDEQSWVKSEGILRVDVGGDLGPEMVHAYKAYLDLRHMRSKRIVFGDLEEQAWRSIGLDGHDYADSIAGGITVCPK